MIQLVDSHCHLTHGRLRPQLEAALERAREASVAACVCAAGDLAESRAGRELACTHRQVWFMAGIHPHERPLRPAGVGRQCRQTPTHEASRPLLPRLAQDGGLRGPL